MRGDDEEERSRVRSPAIRYFSLSRAPAVACRNLTRHLQLGREIFFIFFFYSLNSLKCVTGRQRNVQR